ncbi:DNA-binding response regulator [Camelimonas fluminis]|uniref:ActR/PrrA/RegA family redox response regulator transcription factor n=1 Tax=Camelimonas fluminis TaxID=1576911 RepID=A0ABV7UI27_9HYPH|nr:ActR/PrrA/RegA family redox response regulator transcription factor [Camelimonas fluminis]GHE75889.1 DNA-binding response regulator [Camelimonas fluminis]
MNGNDDFDQPMKLDDFIDKSLLIVDDDLVLSTRLLRAMDSRGYSSLIANTIADALAAVETAPPAFAIVDMRLGANGNGLDVIRKLSEVRPEARAVMLTGYGNIATAVAAVKMGAFDYIPKPATADQIHMVLMASPVSGKVEVPGTPMSADRVRWEHIQRVFESTGRNVSKTAGHLNMHRRTLQRILSKHAPREGALKGN